MYRGASHAHLIPLQYHDAQKVMLRCRYNLALWHFTASIVNSRLRLLSRRGINTNNVDEPSEEDQKLAREWLSTFDLAMVPRRVCEISFSRSSGPGGQNVNK